MTEVLPYQVPEMGRVRQIHMIGIGGSGMCGIAEVLVTQGYRVTGSDLQRGETVSRLASLGVRTQIGHSVENVGEADVVVVSSAVPEDNPELRAARERRIPVIQRAEMLGELMRYRHGIAVAGTHGKTTTTSLITAVFDAAKLDPTFVIGGLVTSHASNARLGAGRYLIAEADESDGSFLSLQPMSAVITNIDRDHMGTFGHDFATLKRSFVDFVHRLPFYGSAVLCIDDAEVRSILPDVSRPMLTYGESEDADYRIAKVHADGMHWSFEVVTPEHGVLSVRLAVPGRHNVQNACAAVAIGLDEGLSVDAIRSGLESFSGVGRRFETTLEVAIEGCRVTLVDDYGHHPTEVAAVIETAREVWPERRLVMTYQPHRYSRTRDLYDDFVRVLSTVDALVVLDVYSAGEAPIAGADGKALCQGLRARASLDPVFAETPEEALAVLPGLVRDGDVVIVQGAGNVNRISQSVLAGAHGGVA